MSDEKSGIEDTLKFREACDDLRKAVLEAVEASRIFKAVLWITCKLCGLDWEYWTKDERTEADL